MPVFSDAVSVCRMTAAWPSDGSPSWWRVGSTWAECRRLLPDHPWLGEPGLGEPGSHRHVSRGDIWVVTADVLARRTGRNARHSRPYDRFEFDTLATSAAAADVIRGGTLLRVSEIGGYQDPGCAWPSVGRYIEFELPGGGARVRVQTHAASAVTRDSSGSWSDEIRWCDMMAAAVIVPANHPFARNSALLAVALGRIGEAATSIAHTAAAPPPAATRE